MEVIVLAGGFGTRLSEVVKDVPKPMALVNKRPFLEYLLDDIIKNGATKIILAVGYKKEIIMNHFKSNYKDCAIEYSIESEPLGTGGCVKQALSLCKEDFIFVVNGDTMFKINYQTMLKNKQNMIACKKMYNFDRYGEVEIANNKIIKFKEKKYCKEGYINGGIYLISKDIFQKFDIPNKFSLESDFFEKHINKLNLVPLFSNSYFIDIGIPSDYLKVQVDFSE